MLLNDAIEENGYEGVRLRVSAGRDGMRIPFAKLNCMLKMWFLPLIVWMCIIAMNEWVVKMHKNMEARTEGTVREGCMPPARNPEAQKR